MKTRIRPRHVRHARIRAKISGSKTRPRVSVFRSNKYMYVQIVDDTSGKTLVGLTDQSIIDVKNRQERAQKLGSTVAQAVTKLGIKEVVFDRSGYAYHGRVKALAEGLRKGGIKF